MNKNKEINDYSILTDYQTYSLQKSMEYYVQDGNVVTISTTVQFGLDEIGGLSKEQVIQACKEKFPENFI